MREGTRDGTNSTERGHEPNRERALTRQREGTNPTRERVLTQQREGTNPTDIGTGAGRSSPADRLCRRPGRRWMTGRV